MQDRCRWYSDVAAVVRAGNARLVATPVQGVPIKRLSASLTPWP
jgi:hypothetical protein